MQTGTEAERLKDLKERVNKNAQLLKDVDVLMSELEQYIAEKKSEQIITTANKIIEQLKAFDNIYDNADSNYNSSDHPEIKEQKDKYRNQLNSFIFKVIFSAAQLCWHTKDKNLLKERLNFLNQTLRYQDELSRTEKIFVCKTFCSNFYRAGDYYNVIVWWRSLARLEGRSNWEFGYDFTDEKIDKLDPTGVLCLEVVLSMIKLKSLQKNFPRMDNLRTKERLFKQVIKHSKTHTLQSVSDICQYMPLDYSRFWRIFLGQLNDKQMQAAVDALVERFYVTPDADKPAIDTILTRHCSAYKGRTSFIVGLIHKDVSVLPRASALGKMAAVFTIGSTQQALVNEHHLYAIAQLYKAGTIKVNELEIVKYCSLRILKHYFKLCLRQSAIGMQTCVFLENVVLNIYPADLNSTVSKSIDITTMLEQAQNEKIDTTDIVLQGQIDQSLSTNLPHIYVHLAYLLQSKFQSKKVLEHGTQMFPQQLVNCFVDFCQQTKIPEQQLRDLTRVMLLNISVEFLISVYNLSKALDAERRAPNLLCKLCYQLIRDEEELSYLETTSGMFAQLESYVKSFDHEELVAAEPVPQPVDNESNDLITFENPNGDMQENTTSLAPVPAATTQHQPAPQPVVDTSDEVAQLREALVLSQQQNQGLQQKLESANTRIESAKETYYSLTEKNQQLARRLKQQSSREGSPSSPRCSPIHSRNNSVTENGVLPSTQPVDVKKSLTTEITVMME